jgi:hypothetical protein
LYFAKKLNDKKVIKLISTDFFSSLFLMEVVYEHLLPYII